MPEVVTNEDKSIKDLRFICVHSMFVESCLGCWHGHAMRQKAHLEKLEASTALPIRERIEKAVREQMQNCYQVYKGVPPTVQDWVGGALHYVMWGLDRDLPMIEIDAERTRLERAVIEAAKAWRRAQGEIDGTKLHVVHAWDELRRTTDALIDFESSQRSPPSG